MDGAYCRTDDWNVWLTTMIMMMLMMVMTMMINLLMIKRVIMIVNMMDLIIQRKESNAGVILRDTLRCNEEAVHQLVINE